MSDSTYPSQRVCEYCGSGFSPTKSYQRSCGSADCTRALRREYYHKTKPIVASAVRECSHCHQMFDVGNPALPATDRSYQRYCTKRCRQGALGRRKANLPPLVPTDPSRPCEHCQKAFRVVNTHITSEQQSYQRFCSVKCREAAKHLRQGNEKRTVLGTDNRECEHCHHIFAPRFITVIESDKLYERYCSEECRIDARYLISAARRQAGTFQPTLRGREERQRILTFLGGVCVHCGYDKDWRGLEIDHIHGGGRKELASMSKTAYYKKIYADPSPYQVLCATCNRIKREVNREHAPGMKRKVRSWHTPEYLAKVGNSANSLILNDLETPSLSLQKSESGG